MNMFLVFGKKFKWKRWLVFKRHFLLADVFEKFRIALFESILYMDYVQVIIWVHQA